MYISEKFDTYYNNLSNEDKIVASRAVLTLCDDHEKYMNSKKKQMQELLLQASVAAAALDLEKLKAIKDAVEKIKNNIISIDRYIEINFGL